MTIPNHAADRRVESLESSRRSFGYDNLKLLLILLVIFAHVLEFCGDFPGREVLVLGIYSFHMPAFLFLSGLFCPRRPKVGQFAVLYLVFQTLYLLFLHWIGENASLKFQYTRPVWVMWYLMTLICCFAISRFFLESSLQRQVILIGVSLVLALALGYDTSVDYDYSVSRTVTFAPFFLGGCLLQPYRGALRERLKRLGWWRLGILLGGLALLLGLLRAEKDIFVIKMLYGSYGYKLKGFNPDLRGLQLLTAGLWIGWLLVLQSLLDRSIPAVTVLGRNTLWIFLLHGFVLRWLKQKELLAAEGTQNLLYAAAISLLLTAAFGNPLADAVLGRIFCMRKRKKS